MNKHINFSNLGGSPFDQQTLEFMQSAYTGISEMLAGVIGDNVIVSGCVVNGNSISAGWVIVGGELLPFAASQTGVQATFVVRELTESLVFEDGNSKPVEITRYAEFGTSGNAIGWDTLKRLPQTISEHILSKANPHGVTKAQVGLGNLPNAMSDNVSSNASNVLASTAMVHNAIKDRIVYTGRMELSLSASSNSERFTSEGLVLSGHMIIGHIFQISTASQITDMSDSCLRSVSLRNSTTTPVGTLAGCVYSPAQMPAGYSYYFYYMVIKL